MGPGAHPGLLEEIVVCLLALQDSLFGAVIVGIGGRSVDLCRLLLMFCQRVLLN
jgi:hypothetical protein